MYYTTEIGICIPYNASLQTFIEILKKKGLSDTYIQSAAWAKWSWKYSIRQIQEEIEKIVLRAYTYSLPSPCHWNSFDYGTVQAFSNEHARELAKAELDENFTKANKALEELNMSLTYDPKTIEVKLDQ